MEMHGILTVLNLGENQRSYHISCVIQPAKSYYVTKLPMPLATFFCEDVLMNSAVLLSGVTGQRYIINKMTPSNPTFTLKKCWIADNRTYIHRKARITIPRVRMNHSQLLTETQTISGWFGYPLNTWSQGGLRVRSNSSVFRMSILYMHC